MRLTVPPNWLLTLVLAGVAAGLLALTVIVVAQRHL
jgi:hypothetical protein